MKFKILAPVFLLVATIAAAQSQTPPPPVIGPPLKPGECQVACSTSGGGGGVSGRGPGGVSGGAGGSGWHEDCQMFCNPNPPPPKVDSKPPKLTESDGGS